MPENPIQPPRVLKPDEPPRVLKSDMGESNSGPTIEFLLREIAAVSPKPWFPSTFATDAGIPRDSLDEPLAELRLTGLARIADWVRGLGQGYSLTPVGEACVKDPTILAKLRAGPPVLPPPELQTLTAATTTVSMPLPPVPEPKPAPIDPAVKLDLRPPTITPAFLLANLAWFLMGIIWCIRWNLPVNRFLADGDNDVLMKLGAVKATSLLHDEWWRLITSTFVHGNLLHLLANMFALGMTGSLAEVLWGRWRLALIYLYAGLAGSCLAMALEPVTNGAVLPLVGASGAIWGLMTSLLAWLILHRDRLPPALVADWFRRLSMMFLLNIGVSFLPGISWQGHLGGAMAGFLIAGLVNALRSGDRIRRAGAAMMLALFPIACVGGLVLTMQSSETWGKVAQGEFNHSVRPFLLKIRPADIQGLEEDVKIFTLRGLQSKEPAKRDELRQRIEKSLKNTTEVLTRVERTPPSDSKVNLAYLQAREYAEAHRDMLDQLQRMLDMPGVPDKGAWQAFQEKRKLLTERALPVFGTPVNVVIPPHMPPPPKPEREKTA